jgi:thiamine-phosphate pyrophosphorylase
MMRFDPTLYVITDRIIGRGRPLDDLVAAAVRGGATAIQLRDKAWPARLLLEAGRRLMEITRPAGVPLIVNDRVDVGLALDADGVHVGQEDIPVADARRILGPGKIVGASAATVEEARQAEADGADYVGVGSLFPTASKPDAGESIGPAALRPIKAAVAIPVVAIGGITHDNAADAIRAGADGIAVISAVMAAEDVAGAARRLLEAVLAARG